jgi:hypothetical protein
MSTRRMPKRNGRGNGSGTIHRDGVALRARADSAKTRFVDSEIEIGLLYCLLAQSRSNGDRRAHFIRHATRAHDVAEEWIWKLKEVPCAEFADLTGKLETLRDILDDLS